MYLVLAAHEFDDYLYASCHFSSLSMPCTFFTQKKSYERGNACCNVVWKSHTLYACLPMGTITSRDSDASLASILSLLD